MNEIDRAAWEAKMERQSSYVDFIEETAKTDPIGAAVMLAEGLMRGDQRELRLGYGLGSALISTIETMQRWNVPLTDGQIGVVVEKIAVPRPGLVEYGPSTTRG